MAALIVSAVSIALAFLSYIPAVNWLCLIGFTFAIAAWTLGRKIRQTNPGDRLAMPTMVIGIIGTFVNLAAILVAFILGGLLMGGFVTF